jgi:hypothetical protein
VLIGSIPTTNVCAALAFSRAFTSVTSPSVPSPISRGGVQPESVDPRPETAGPDLQMETGAIVMQYDRSECANFSFGELVYEACHKNLLVGRTHVPERPYAPQLY